MERKERHFNRKGEEKADKGEGGDESRLRPRHAVTVLHKKGHVKGVGRRVEIKGNDSQQHKDRTREGVDKEFDGSVLWAVFFVSPNADEEIHGHKTDFPKDVKEKEVKGNEH